MNSDKKTIEFYERLEEQLTANTQWPALYLYKFIVPADAEKVEAIKQIFNGLQATINTRDSSKGTYTSVSIKVIMESPEAVIKKYKEVSKVEGVISL